MASLVAIATAATPTRASADWLFTPFVGSTFGGSATITGGGENFSSDFNRNFTYGASLDWMGGGVFGFGVDLGYTPNFFKTTDTNISLVGDGNVTTFMANVIVGAPVGPVRPYASGGVGLIKQKVDNVGQFFGSVDSTDFGYNVGGGVMGFFSDNIGIRGDIRYMRSLRKTDLSNLDVELGEFKFWRGAVGVTFKF